MTNIITVTKEIIGNEELNSVNARELWERLESKQEYAHWIKKRLELFVKNEDYIVFDKNIKNPSGGRPQKEYVLTLDTAKHIAMLERNEKGREFRQYFINAEKQTKLTPAEQLLESVKMTVRLEREMRRVQEYQLLQFDDYFREK